MGVELTLIQEPELMALDLFGTVLCAQSHVCEPVIEDSCLLRGYHAKARGSCFVMKARVFSCRYLSPCWYWARALSVSLFRLMSGHLV